MLAAFSAVAACEDSGAASETADSTIAPPTFERIAVTPVPTATPVPTIPPTETPVPLVVNRDPPEFPRELDPDLVEDRPDYELIFAGWAEVLRNTEIHYAEWEQPVHLCSGGVILNESGSNPDLAEWRIIRSPAISSYDWGTVSIEVDIIGGRWAGRKWSMLTISRREGAFTVTANYRPGPVEFTRSEQCLAL
jgi:hypothetical protein